MQPPSFRSQVVTRRTYSRPLNPEGTVFETFPETVARVIDHQQWLWERAAGRKLRPTEVSELEELQQLMLDRKVMMSGRTMWLGGTDVAKKREASQFNCAHVEVQSVSDVVDAFWLLLQGCGVGFTPRPGVLNGFSKEMDIKVIRSTRAAKGGLEHNSEQYDKRTRTWTIKIGDSAEAWAKSVGKLLAGKFPADQLVLDFQRIRPAGERLAGYGWISSGDAQVAQSFQAIAAILNRKAGQLLDYLDILDVINWLGSTLSSRRSAEIALMDADHPQWQEFADAKREYWVDNPQRAQSNNSLVFRHQPSRRELQDLFARMLANGGSEPGFVNGTAAEVRAPWFRGLNPCAEILLGATSFCNLTETNLPAFNDDFPGLLRAHYLAARANYRQTAVNLRDGILQDSWHELSEFLRLTGVGVTGIVQWGHGTNTAAWQTLRDIAHRGVNSMADELGLPRSKAVTTVKPSGTLSKVMDVAEGVHKPMSKYIFNNILFSKYDPLVPMLRDAGYRVFDHPFDGSGVLATLPVKYDNIKFDTVARQIDGKEVKLEVNLESAVDQLERYKLLMDNYVDHSCSITVSYDWSEVDDIVDWLSDNWDTYVGVSWLLRNDPTKTAADLGFPYLPQEAVTRETYEAYVSTLKEVDIDLANTLEEITAEECAGGACPVR